MNLLPAPRFHIMSQEEIAQSIRKINVERRISDLERKLWQIQMELGSAKDHRDFMHKVGIYHPNFMNERMRLQALEWYYQ